MMESFASTSPMAEIPLVIWFVSAVLILAAVIDGMKLKVPNWLTFPLIIGGWLVSALLFGWSGLGASLLGTGVGLVLLLPAYAIGGMGAGDVKLLAGVGAWIWGSVTFFAFCFSAIAGGLIAIGMVVYQRKFSKHAAQFKMIASEIMVVRNPETLSEIAAERKPSMMLLPYGIPIAIGTILYFAMMNFFIA
jgi:prepilin peptidase CpaA